MRSFNRCSKCVSAFIAVPLTALLQKVASGYSSPAVVDHSLGMFVLWLPTG